MFPIEQGRNACSGGGRALDWAVGLPGNQDTTQGYSDFGGLAGLPMREVTLVSLSDPLKVVQTSALIRCRG